MILGGESGASLHFCLCWFMLKHVNRDTSCQCMVFYFK